jgi:hypothetical protein
MKRNIQDVPQTRTRSPLDSNPIAYFHRAIRRVLANCDDVADAFMSADAREVHGAPSAFFDVEV